MAGSFGYDADTIDVSLKMGELSLLPAVRKARADTLIVADGTSCRHQIHDGSGRDALHVARVLAMSVAAGNAKTDSLATSKKRAVRRADCGRTGCHCRYFRPRWSAPTRSRIG